MAILSPIPASPNPDQSLFWISGLKYCAPSEKEARKMHRKHLANERKKIALIAKQERERRAAENAKFQGLSFLEGFKLAEVELAERRALDAEKLRFEWAKDYCIYVNPDQLCCYCGTSIPTKRVWFFDLSKRKVLAVIGLNGKVVDRGNWHPHVYTINICLGADESVDGARALFLGLNPGSAFYNVKDWLMSQLDHRCWWDSQLPHYVERFWSFQPCGCGMCRACQLPLCKCTANLLSRKYPISHPIPPMTREAFNELVKWAEDARLNYKWDEKTVIFNANYIASLPVEEVESVTQPSDESTQGGDNYEYRDDVPYGV